VRISGGYRQVCDLCLFAATHRVTQPVTLRVSQPGDAINVAVDQMEYLSL